MQLSTRFNEALVYAAQLHATQRRKGSDTPYVAHLLAVASLVLEHGGDEDTAIAALLHDAVEDQGGPATRAAIAERFGEPVAAIVDACSDAQSFPKPPWRERKLAHLEVVRGADRATRLVLAADKLHNVRSLLADHAREGEAIWSRFRGGRDGTLWYYRAMAEILDGPEACALVAELRCAVGELERRCGAR